MTRSPNELDAIEALAAMASGRLSAEALTRACLERIGARDSVVRAFAHLDPERALAEARSRDRAREAGPAGRLNGLPLGVKDIIDTHDMPTSHGSPIHAGHRPSADAACVALAREAGAVALGKTVTTEFALRHPGADGEPAQSCAHARRIVERVGGGRRRFHGACRVRHADGRVDHPSGIVLRRDRLQALVRHDQSHRGETIGRELRHRRALCALRR